MKTISRLSVALVLAATCVFGASAAVTARDAFVNAPKEVFMLLERNDRLDMLDYFDNKLDRKVENRLNGTSHVTALNDRSITIAMTPSSTYQLAVLPSTTSAEGPVMLIITMSTPARDSRIRFYSYPDWKELDNARLLAEPDLKAWLTPEGRKNIGMVEGMVPFIMAEATYDEATSELGFHNNLSAFLSPDIYEMIAPYMLPTITYKWDGKKMVQAK